MRCLGKVRLTPFLTRANVVGGAQVSNTFPKLLWLDFIDVARQLPIIPGTLSVDGDMFHPTPMYSFENWCK